MGKALYLILSVAIMLVMVSRISTGYAEDQEKRDLMEGGPKAPPKMVSDEELMEDPREETAREKYIRKYIHYHRRFLRRRY